jgi:putative ABC transport system permease protein
VRWLPVRRNWFSVLQVPVRAGREFALDDEVRPPSVTVIDEDLAVALFGRESPLGRHIRFAENALDLEVVGMVGRMVSVDAQADRRWMTMYVPDTGQRADFDPRNVGLRGAGRDAYGQTIAVRTVAGATSMLLGMQAGVADVDRRMTVVGFTNATEALAEKFKPMRIVRGVAGAFAAVALSLTMMALYALVSNSVFRRRREIAIRISLGSTTVNLVRIITAETAGIVVGGLTIGLAGALLIGIGLRSTLPAEVHLTEPMALVDVVILLVSVAALATLIPLGRALRIRPSEALKSDG